MGGELGEGVDGSVSVHGDRNTGFVVPGPEVNEVVAVLINKGSVDLREGDLGSEVEAPVCESHEHRAHVRGGDRDVVALVFERELPQFAGDDGFTPPGKLRNMNFGASRVVSGGAAPCEGEQCGDAPGEQCGGPSSQCGGAVRGHGLLFVSPARMRRAGRVSVEEGAAPTQE